jgi:hypothetical protein
MAAAFGGDVMRKQHDGGLEASCVTQLPYSGHSTAMVQPNDGQIHFNIDRRSTTAYPDMATYQQMSTDASMIKFDQTVDFPAPSAVCDGRMLPLPNIGSPRAPRVLPAPMSFPAMNWFDPPEHHTPQGHPVHPCAPGTMPSMDCDFPSPREQMTAGPCADRRITQQQGPLNLNLNLNAMYDEIDDVKPALMADDQVSQAMSATRNGYSGNPCIFHSVSLLRMHAWQQQISYASSRPQRTTSRTLSLIMHRDFSVRVIVLFSDIQDIKNPVCLALCTRLPAN